jgi:isopenicillin N synthase-like dioxygenase
VKNQGLIPRNLVETLKSQGYLSLELGQMTSDKIAAVFLAGGQFFTTSAAEKNASRLPNDFGYRPVGIEYSSAPDRPDLAESFSVSARTSNASLGNPLAQTLFNSMREVFDDLEAIVEQVGVQLAETLGESIGPELRGGFHRWSRLQLNYSRPAQVEAPFINEPHEDGDFMTLACATGPGLELKTSSTAFTSAATSAGEALVIPGEILWLLSGGLIEPLWHCVRPQIRATERMALLFFGDLDPGLCEPWIHNEINSNVNIAEKVLRSVTRFGLKGFSLEQPKEQE